MKLVKFLGDALLWTFGHALQIICGLLMLALLVASVDGGASSEAAREELTLEGAVLSVTLHNTHRLNDLSLLLKTADGREIHCFAEGWDRTHLPKAHTLINASGSAHSLQVVGHFVNNQDFKITLIRRGEQIATK